MSKTITFEKSIDGSIPKKIMRKEKQNKTIDEAI